MADESRVMTIIAAWEEARDRGETVPVPVLCRDDPDLVSAVEDGIRRLFGPSAFGPVETDTHDPNPDFAVTSGGDRLPGYEIECELARGGMGVVYKARQKKLNRLTAIKMVLGGERASRRHLLRFLAEAAAVAAVDHPHVVRVYESGEHAGRPFLALEYCGGGTLAGRLKAGPRFSPRDAAALVQQIADGVQAAHARQILHRDLKPSNVLFDDAGRPKVADFGLAKQLGGEDFTPAGQAVGTLQYMAPEQTRGDSQFVGPGIDVWALGVILYECLTGTRPFQAPSDVEVLRRIVTGEPKSPRKLIPEIPKDLELICLKCLRKEPHERYATAGVLAADLGRFLAGEPVVARPISPSLRTIKWVRRNPVPTALITSLALLLLISTAGGILTARQYERAATQEKGRLQAELDKRTEQEKRQVEAVQASIRLAMQRGGAAEAVTAFDRAEQSGLPVPPAMRLDKVRALFVLGRVDDALAEFAAIDKAALPADLRGPADLLAGAMRLGGWGHDDSAAIALIRSALEQPLPDGDRHYARGLIAATTPDALAAFAAAVDADPTHVDARAMRVLTLTCLGRTQEAIRLGEQSRPLAPSHPYFTTLLAIAWALEGNEAETRRFVDGLRPLFPDAGHFDAVKQFVLILANVRNESLKSPGPLSPTMIFKVVTALSSTGSAAKALKGFWGGENLSATLFPTRFPPYLRAGLKFLFDEQIANWNSPVHGNPLIGQLLRQHFPDYRPGPSVFQFTDAAGAEAARKKVATHPDGTLKVLYAFRLNEMTAEEIGRFGYTERNREFLAAVGATLEDAARTPGLYTRPIAVLEDAWVAYYEAGMARPDRPRREPWCRKAFDLVREWIRAYGPLTTADQFRQAADAAYQAGQFSAARQFLDDWLNGPRTDDDYYKLRARVEFHILAYPSARTALGRLSPDVIRADKELTSIWDACRHALGLTESAPPPRPSK